MNKTTKDKDMTTQEIKTSAFYVIDNVITLKANVSNGCVSDMEALKIEEARLQDIKVWAKKNDLLQDIKHYLSSHNFGHILQFAAREVASFFNN